MKYISMVSTTEENMYCDMCGFKIGHPPKGRYTHVSQSEQKSKTPIDLCDLCYKQVTRYLFVITSKWKLVHV